MRPKISFELFPPKNLSHIFSLREVARDLSALDPEFISVTCGAGGTSTNLTRMTAKALREEGGMSVVPHITCTSGTRDQILDQVREYAEAGVRSVVGLRGDAPKGTGQFRPHPDGFQDVHELISAISARGDMSVFVSAYPDPHPESFSEDQDVTWLKRKADAGATQAITQFFFEAETFLRFRDRCASAGVGMPLVAGILPIRNWSGAKAFAQKCGAATPSRFDDAFCELTEPQARDLGTALCAELCDQLATEGVEGLHFYALNKSDMVSEVVKRCFGSS